MQLFTTFLDIPAAPGATMCERRPAKLDLPWSLASNAEKRALYSSHILRQHRLLDAHRPVIDEALVVPITLVRSTENETKRCEQWRPYLASTAQMAATFGVVP